MAKTINSTIIEGLAEVRLREGKLAIAGAERFTLNKAMNPTEQLCAVNDRLQELAKLGELRAELASVPTFRAAHKTPAPTDATGELDEIVPGIKRMRRPA